ncbi:MAG: T9SS type A sorting domain-containing protein [Ekhidna sp.]
MVQTKDGGVVWQTIPALGESKAFGTDEFNGTEYKPESGEGGDDLVTIDPNIVGGSGNGSQDACTPPEDGVLWIEDFDGYEDGTTSSEKWTIDGTPEGSFGVSGGLLIANHTGAAVNWQSQVIEISQAQTPFDIAACVVSTPNMETDQDSLILYYRTDGGDWQELAKRFGSINPSEILIAKDVTANSNVEVKMIIRNSNGEESHQIGYVAVYRGDIGGINVLSLEKDNNSGKIIPNPAKSTFELQNVTDIEELSIIDMSGKLMMTVSFKKGQEKIVNIEALPQGIYTVLFEQEGTLKSLKLEKQ